MIDLEGVVAGLGRLLWMVGLAALAAASGGAWAVCVQLDGIELPELQARLAERPPTWDAGLTPGIEALRPVYQRLSQAAGVRPALLVCDNPVFNATAEGTRERGAVVFFLPLVRFLDGRSDEVAAVMAHEFAHLLLQHTQQNAAAARNIGQWAQRIAIDQYRRTGDAAAAVARAKQLGEVEVAKYSRAHEREADEKGFSLAVTLAGFSGEGAKNLARKFGKLPASERPAYLDTHPGWLERFDKADLLTLNQRYLDQAAPLLQAHRWPELEALVERWLQVVPDSGAAWYYKGRLLARKPASRSTITRTFEESLARYVDNGVLGTRSQEDQAELDDAWYSLCRALHDEGFRHESAACSKYIVSEEKRELFRTRVFRGHLLVGGGDPPAGNLLMARNADGSKLITNDRSVAASRGAYLPMAPAWRAQRFPP